MIYDDVARVDRWPLVAVDLLMNLCLLPLLFINFRGTASGDASCSDASEEGAGVSWSRQLSSSGEEFLRRQMVKVSNVGAGLWMLVESFAGIGSARLAAHRLGLKPAAYVAIEKD